VAFPNETLLTHEIHLDMRFLPSHVCFRKAEAADIEIPQRLQIMV
jgi:hypothetical protein